MNNRLIKSNDAGAGACTNTVDLYNPFPDGGGVALYQLNGNANDVSGNYDATTVTDVTWGGAGQFGTSAAFNGSTSEINYPLLNGFLNTRTTVSISLWFKCGTQAETGTFFSDYAGYSFNVYLAIDINGKISGATRYSGNTLEMPASSNSYDDNSWHNIVVVLDQNSNTRKHYVDGIEINSETIPSGSWNGDSNQKVTSGVLFYTIGSFNQNKFNGSIDQVRIFNRALRPYEVEALYTEEYCTPTIVPSEHFNTVTYTGNGGANSITGVGFQPDFTWIKSRVSTNPHNLFDSIRGAGFSLMSNNTAAEIDETGYFTSFDADGFSFGLGGGNTNFNGYDYVSWNFKAGGAAVTNTDGTITSQVSANTEAGFSVVSYTGNGANGTVGHGLGVTPNIVLTKRRNSTSNWSFNGNFGGLIYGTNKLALNDTIGISADTNEVLAANSNNFTAGTSGAVGASGGTYIAYCFAEVEGFSNFGSYVGTGASGNTVITGFEPAFVICKRTDASTGGWAMFDNKRSVENPRDELLFAQASDAEYVNNTNKLNFFENGFSLESAGGNTNASGASYIYMAFAADPTAVEPTLEDSFNTVVYTGNGGTQSVTGVGFQPDFTWIKDRTTTYHHILQDSVRGINSKLGSDGTWEENNAAELSLSYGQITSFDSNGFTVNGTSQLNRSGDNFVSWNWKGAEIPAINSNGSIPSVVSANPAAGFSIVSYKGNSIIGSTVGHGLNTTPDVVIYKGRQEGLPQYFASWGVYHSSLGATQRLWLNQTSAAQTAGGGDWINNTEPTDSVFTVGEYYTNWTGRDFIAYCFAEVAGFSKFGSYTGTGSNGNFITTGFEPAFLMVKRSDSADNWVIVDNKRGTSNSLFPDLSSQELSNSGAATFSSTGFTVNGASGGWNNASGTYIYMAFANQF